MSDKVEATFHGGEMPEFGTEEYRQWAALFNDITRTPRPREWHLLFSQRRAITDYLWAQGWRRDVRPEDVTERPSEPRVTVFTPGGRAAAEVLCRQLHGLHQVVSAGDPCAECLAYYGVTS